MTGQPEIAHPRCHLEIANVHFAFGDLAFGKSQIHHAIYQALVCSPQLGSDLFPIGDPVRVARIKLGYYPLPPAEGARLRRLLDFNAGASAVDPCAGTGAALHQLTQGVEVKKHGVELDAGRATLNVLSKRSVNSSCGKGCRRMPSSRWLGSIWP
jgi:hypothetical protein